MDPGPQQVRFRIEPRGQYLHAEVHDRDTPAHMREFLLAVKAACLAHGCPNIVITVRESRAMFKPEDYGLGAGFAKEMITPSCRVALVGDSGELRHAHDYIELVARQQKVNVRSFKDTQSALRWLQSSDDLGGAPAGSDALEPARPPKLA